MAQIAATRATTPAVAGALAPGTGEELPVDQLFDDLWTGDVLHSLLNDDAQRAASGSSDIEPEQAGSGPSGAPAGSTTSPLLIMGAGLAGAGGGAHQSLLQAQEVQQLTSVHFGGKSAVLGGKTVSHSSIEKQRRDRINTLIDELRTLVPSPVTMRAPDGSEIKRPKHAVLADTIALLRTMQLKVRTSEAELARLKQVQAQQQAALAAAHAAAAAAAAAAQQQHQQQQQQQQQQHVLKQQAPVVKPEQPAPAEGSVQALLARGLSPGAPALAQATCSPPNELPWVPADAPPCVGVVVEEAAEVDGAGGLPTRFYVKVNCRDRRGLLCDIADSLKELPLKITRAAITTTERGTAYDVFEVVADPTGPGVTAQDLQCQVHAALHRQREVARVASATVLPTVRNASPGEPQAPAQATPAPLLAATQLAAVRAALKAVAAEDERSKPTVAGQDCADGRSSPLKRPRAG